MAGSPDGPVLAAIAGAWLLAVVAQLSGSATTLHHHALIEGGQPLWLATILFLLGWQVMVVAMMLPASLPSIAMFRARVAGTARPRQALLAFLGSYATAWAAFGLLAFLGDDVLHHVVDATPWLAARPWLIEAGVIGLAGAYQFTPLKRRSLDACRHPTAPAPSAAAARRGSFALGFDHAGACVGSSSALMLLMFAEGFANVAWMAVLAAVMVYEAAGRHGRGAANAVGFLLLLLAGMVLSVGG